MIPKVIHYCWFGGNPIPQDVKKYINTWKEKCSDYKIVEWNESNFDVNENRYCREAYSAGKWAFVSDYARLKILYDNGGIYMDTDVEVCKNFDDLLEYSAWSGFEANDKIPTGTFAAIKGNEWVRHLLSHYDTASFKKEDGTYDLTTNVIVITRMTKEKYDVSLDNKFQIFGEGNALFPFDYFCAKDYRDDKIYITDNTYTIHHFAGSWLSPWQRARHNIKIAMTKVLGKHITEKIAMLLRR